MKTARILALGLFGCALLIPATASEAAVQTNLTVNDLATVPSVRGVDQTLTLPDGRKFVVPDPGMEVSLEPIVPDSALHPGDVLIVADKNGALAAEVGSKTYGGPAGLKRLEQIEATADSNAAKAAFVHGADGGHDHDGDAHGDEPQAHATEANIVTAGIVQAAAPIKCTSTDHLLKSWTWGRKIVQWQYNPNRQMGTDAGATLQRATKSWQGSIMDACGRPGNSLLRTSYLGTTSRAPLPSATGGCGPYAPGVNVIGWGPLSTRYLAVTCTYSIGATPYRSDQLYNTNYRWNTGSSTLCSGTRYDLQGVATHEFGHSFGLGHAQAASDQVMKPAAKTCESAMRRLGRGDVIGINKLYR